MPPHPNRRLTDNLRELLGKQATKKLLQEVAPEVLAGLSAGSKLPTLAALIAKKVVQLALDPKRDNQWAVELIWDRVEGKAVQGAPVSDGGRRIHEHLDSITRDHLNALTGAIARSAKAAEAERRAGAETASGPPGPPAGRVDLPADGAEGPEVDPGESPVEEGTEGQGGEQPTDAGNPPDGLGQ
jgi:hypothetical protein